MTDSMVSLAESLGVDPVAFDDALRTVDSASAWSVGRISDARDALDRLEVYAVGRLRQDGLTWAEIGLALGVSKQAAQKRFARLMA